MEVAIDNGKRGAKCEIGLFSHASARHTPEKMKGKTMSTDSHTETSHIQQVFSSAIAPYRLLNHPFYQAWSAGTLPRAALDLYAREYGSFIGTISKGWVTLGDEETAHEEEEHAELWEVFAKALGTSVGPVVTKEVETLLSVSSELFASEEGALGALYAFEVQQPETASSKLAGLRAFYPVSNEAEKYFDEHSRNHHEARKLEARIAMLSAEKQERARNACALMGKALWDGLTGIHGETGKEGNTCCNGPCGTGSCSHS